MGKAQATKGPIFQYGEGELSSTSSYGIRGPHLAGEHQLGISTGELIIRPGVASVVGEVVPVPFGRTQLSAISKTRYGVFQRETTYGAAKDFMMGDQERIRGSMT
jgi:hypothetical protein